MKTFRKWVREEHDTFRTMLNEMKYRFTYRPDWMAECKVCGCLIAKTTAVKGKPEVKTRLKYPQGYWAAPCGMSGGETEDYIDTPYYCKIHAEGQA